MIYYGWYRYQLTYLNSPKEKSYSILRNRLKLFSNVTLASKNSFFYVFPIFANVRYRHLCLWTLGIDCSYQLESKYKEWLIWKWFGDLSDFFYISSDFILGGPDSNMFPHLIGGLCDWVTTYKIVRLNINLLPPYYYRYHGPIVCLYIFGQIKKSVGSDH